MRRSRVRLLYPAPTSDPPQAENLPAGPSSSVTVGQKAELSRLAQSAAMSAFCKNHIVRRWGLFESSSHADLTSIAATASPRWSRAIRSCSVELLERERGHTVDFRRMPEVGRRCICSTQSEYDKPHDIVIHAHSIPPSVDLGS